MSCSGSICTVTVVFLNLLWVVFLCILCECEASVLSKKKKRDFCKNVNAAEGNPGVVSAVGLAGEDLKRLPGRNTSVTQPTVFTKGNVGTSMVFTFWSLKHFMFWGFFSFFSFSSYLV